MVRFKASMGSLITPGTRVTEAKANDYFYPKQEAMLVLGRDTIITSPPYDVPILLLSSLGVGWDFASNLELLTDDD
jgi:hypothetical protein